MKLNQYNVIRTLYESHRTVVYLVQEPQNDSFYVAKMLNAEFPDPAHVERLRQEYLLQSDLNLECVPYAKEWIEVDNIPGIVMNYGGKRLMDLKKSIYFDEQIYLMIQITSALNALHKVGVLHRDINPSNILISDDLQVKIIDFGLAIKSNSTSELFQTSHSLEGTLAYISPEQTGRINQSMDVRSDYYALGATFYQIVTNRPPFNESEDRNRLIHLQIAKRPLAPDSLDTNISPVLSALIMKLLEKNPSDRYQTLDGLLFDLNWLREHPQDFHFRLASQDYSRLFILKNTLFGREDALEALHYFLNTKDAPNWLILRGPNGIGKTTLLKFFKKHLEFKVHKIYYGRFDTKRSSEPFHGLMDAFRELLNDVFLSSNETLTLWKKRIESSLGSSLGVLSTILPEISILLGYVPESVPILALSESKKRFINVVENFIQVFATYDTSIVFCFDDAENMDADTVDLFQSLLVSDVVTSIHILFSTAQKEWGTLLRTNNQLPMAYTLLPLTYSEISVFLEAHHLKLLGDVDGTSEILKITQGHPYTLNYLLQVSLSENRIQFNEATHLFELNIKDFKGKDLPEHIQKWIESLVASLSPTYKSIAFTAALLGETFSIDLLQKATDISLPILQSDLLFLEKRGIFVMKELFLEAPDVTHYQFANFQLFEATLNLFHNTISEASFALANKLYECLSPSDLAPYIFLVTDLFNAGNPNLPISSYELLIQLNDSCAKKHIDSSSFDQAYKYLCYCHQYLSELNLKKHTFSALLPSLINNLYLSLADGACLQGDYLAMNNWFSQLALLPITPIDQRRIHLIRLKSMIAKGNRESAVSEALKIVKTYGISLPPAPNSLQILVELLHIRFQLGNSPEVRLNDLQPMTDENMITVMEIMSLVSSSAYLTCPNLYILLALKQLSIAIKFGASDIVFNAYTLYAMLLCGMFQKYSLGNKIAGIAQNKVEALQDKRLAGKIYVHSGLFVSHFTEPLEKAKSFCQLGYKEAMLHGDYEYAAWGLFVHNLYDFYEGVPLETCLKQFESCASKISNLNQRTQQEFSEVFVRGLKRFVQSPLLTEWSEADDAYRTFIHDSHLSPQSSKFYVNLMDMIYFYLTGGIETAYLASQAAFKDLGTVISTLSTTYYYYFDALIVAAILKKNHSSTSGLPYNFTQFSLLRLIHRDLRWLNQWTELDASSRNHYCALIEAELALIYKKPNKALKFYYIATEEAKRLDLIFEHAISSELLTQYFYTQNQAYIAKPYVHRAISMYKKWGFSAKADQLLDEYPELFFTHKSQHPSQTTTSLSTVTTHQLMDLNTIIQATQALSSVTNEEHMIQSFMGILAQNAGADKSLLFIGDEKSFELKAVWQFTDEDVFLHDNLSPPALYQSTLSHDLERTEYPKSLIQYVQHTFKTLLLSGSEESSLFDQDIYLIAYEPKSVLCLPILLKRQLKGILFLENRTTEGAFTPARMDLIKIITAQLAISMENTKLIGHLEEVVKERTIQLRAVSDQYKQLSVTDQLTGVSNRRALDQRIHFEYNRSLRYNASLSIIIMDLDFFKHVNDTFGHQTGDTTLIHFVKIIQSNIREQDFFGRWGGEEFLIICPETQQSQAIILAEKLRLLVSEKPFPNIDQITVSIGVSTLTAADTVEELIRRADAALYMSKNQGRNQVQFM